MECQPKASTLFNLLVLIFSKSVKEGLLNGLIILNFFVFNMIIKCQNEND